MLYIVPYTLFTPLTNKPIKVTHAQTKLGGCTEPILGYLCRNGVSRTLEILIVKPSPAVESSQSVTAGSRPNQLRIGVVCVCV